jgi:hypothetical protein
MAKERKSRVRKIKIKWNESGRERLNRDEGCVHTNKSSFITQFVVFVVFVVDFIRQICIYIHIYFDDGAKKNKKKKIDTCIINKRHAHSHNYLDTTFGKKSPPQNLAKTGSFVELPS